MTEEQWWAKLRENNRATITVGTRTQSVQVIQPSRVANDRFPKLGKKGDLCLLVGYRTKTGRHVYLYRSIGDVVFS